MISYTSGIFINANLENAIPLDDSLGQQNLIPLNPLEQICSTIFSENAFSKPKLPILISGAGIAGLALANALSNLNDGLDSSLRVPYIIIERDNNPDSRNQGYGLTIRRKNVAYMTSPNVLPNIHERMVTLTGGYEDHKHNGNGKPIQIDLKEDKSKLKKSLRVEKLEMAF